MQVQVRKIRGDPTAGAQRPRADLRRGCQVTVISKLDLLPYVPFSVERAMEDVRRVEPEMQFLPMFTVTKH